MNCYWVCWFFSSAWSNLLSNPSCELFNLVIVLFSSRTPFGSFLYFLSLHRYSLFAHVFSWFCLVVHLCSLVDHWSPLRQLPWIICQVIHRSLFRFILFLWLYCFLSLCVRDFVYVCAIFHLKKIALLSVLLGWLFTGEDFHQLTQLEILGPPETFFGGMQFLCSCTCNFPTRQICN